MTVRKRKRGTDKSDCKCEVCILGKMRTKKMSKKERRKKSEPGDMVYADLKKLSRPDVEGNRWILYMIDDASRISKSKAMTTKSQTMEVMIKMITEFEQTFRISHLKIIQPDSEKTFIKAVMHKWLAENRNLTQLLPTPPSREKQRNGVVERLIGVIGERMRCMHLQNGIPEGMFAGRASEAACYVKNLTPHNKHMGKTPYTEVTGAAPPIHHLRKFGSKCLVKDPKILKFDQNRARVGVFVGYADTAVLQAYKVYMIDTQQVIVSEHVEILEDVQPDGLVELWEGFPDDISDADYEVEGDEHTDSSVTNSESDNDVPIRRNRKRKRGDTSPRHDRSSTPRDKAAGKPATRGGRRTFHQYRMGERVRVTAEAFDPGEIRVKPRDGYYMATVKRDFSQQRFSVILDGEDISHVVSRKDIELDETDVSFERLLRSEAVLKYHIAMKDPDHREGFTQSMFQEWENLRHEYKVLAVEPTPEAEVPKDAQKIKMMWSMELKLDRPPDQRYRSRALGRGDMEESINDDDPLITYSPTVSKETMRLMLHHAVKSEWQIFGLDISKAFMTTDMSAIKEARETYMYPPPGLGIPPGLLFRKLKNLYGFATGPRYFYLDFRNKLKEWGYHPSEMDDCLYMKRDASGKIISMLCTHVDDVLVTGTRKHVEQTLSKLKSVYTITEMGWQPTTYLGLELTYEGKTGIKISQTTMIKELVNQFLTPGDEERDPTIPLMMKLLPRDSTTEAVDKPYRSIIGGLLYVAMNSRPDIAFSVMHLSRFLTNPGAEHWNAAIRLLRYLRRTIDKGIWIRRKPGKDKIRIYSDADLANDECAKSVTGFCIMIGDTLIAWGSRMQTTVAQSTFEAEYTALSHAVKEGMFIAHVIDDMECLRDIIVQMNMEAYDAEIEIYCDNARLVDSIKSGSMVGSRKVRHLRTQVALIRAQLERPNVKISHIAGVANPADLFTKPLTQNEVLRHLTTMNVY
jgi:hypothetical protein